jgi:hypothetical protein
MAREEDTGMGTALSGLAARREEERSKNENRSARSRNNICGKPRSRMCLRRAWIFNKPERCAEAVLAVGSRPCFKTRNVCLSERSMHWVPPGTEMPKMWNKKLENACIKATLKSYARYLKGQEKLPLCIFDVH